MTERLLAPRSVAIVGLSDDPTKHGGRVLANLRRLGFAGDIVGVNPRRPPISGVEVVAALGDLTTPPDVVVSAVPARAVPGVVADAASIGAGTVIVFAGGFAEAGDEGERLQQAIVDARTAGVRVLGPNSGGVIVPSAGLALSFLTCLDRPADQIRSGPVGLVTQSGGTGSYVHNLAAARGGGLAASISTGNEVDLGIADGIDALVDHPEVRAVAVVLETVRNGPAFLAALRRAAEAGTPVVATRLGRSDRGRRLASTHTGALATPARVLEGVLDALGVAVADTPGEMLDVAEVLARTARPAGDRIGIVTHSGGIAILLSDLAAGLTLPDPSPELASRLAPLLSQGAIDNPLDMGGIIGGAHRFAEVVETMGGDHDLVLAVSSAHPPAHTDERVAGLLTLDTPLVHLWMAGDQAAAGLATLRAAGAPVTEEPRAAIKALAALVRSVEVAGPPDRSFEVPPGPLTEVLAKQVVAAWGIPVPDGSRVADEDEAVATADALGYPVVVKVSAAGLAHKTEVGGVHTGLLDADAVRRAVAAIRASMSDRGITIDGFLVERHVAGPEALVGAVQDPVLGPMVVVGIGGVAAEALGDVRMAPAPVAPSQARRMIGALAGLHLLTSPRVGEPADLAGLAELVVRVGDVAASGAVGAIDLNPVIWSGTRWLAADALIEPA